MWKPLSIAPAPHDTAVVAEYGLTDDHRGVRVAMTSGNEYFFRALALHGDSLYGFTGQQDSLGYARDSVRAVEVRRRSTGRTTALGLVGGALYVGLAILISDAPKHR